jgi:hypothetical protein
VEFSADLLEPAQVRQWQVHFRAFDVHDQHVGLEWQRVQDVGNGPLRNFDGRAALARQRGRNIVPADVEARRAAGGADGGVDADRQGHAVEPEVFRHDRHQGGVGFHGGVVTDAQHLGAVEREKPHGAAHFQHTVTRPQQRLAQPRIVQLVVPTQPVTHARAGTTQ